LKGYLVAHWQGGLSLARSFWLNGVVGYVVLVALVVGLRSYLPVYPSMLAFVVFVVWACVGITRSALRVVRSPQATITSKFKAYLALTMVVLVAMGSAADFLLLLQ
jgi:hypothetical protein